MHVLRLLPLYAVVLLAAWPSQTMAIPNATTAGLGTRWLCVLALLHPPRLPHSGHRGLRGFFLHAMLEEEPVPSRLRRWPP